MNILELRKFATKEAKIDSSTLMYLPFGFYHDARELLDAMEEKDRSDIVKHYLLPMVTARMQKIMWIAAQPYNETVDQELEETLASEEWIFYEAIQQLTEKVRSSLMAVERPAIT